MPASPSSCLLRLLLVLDLEVILNLTLLWEAYTDISPEGVIVLVTVLVPWLEPRLSSLKCSTMVFTLGLCGEGEGEGERLCHLL